MPAESLRERSASGASAFATRIAFCEYVTDLPTLPGLESSTYVLAKSSSAGKLLGLAAKVFSPKEISRDVSFSSESETIAYEVTCSSKRELGKAGVKRSIYDMRLLASFSPAITLYAAASKNSYEFLLAFFSSSIRLEYGWQNLDRSILPVWFVCRSSCKLP